MTWWGSSAVLTALSASLKFSSSSSMSSMRLRMAFLMHSWWPSPAMAMAGPAHRKLLLFRPARRCPSLVRASPLRAVIARQCWPGSRLLQMAEQDGDVRDVRV